MSVVQRVPPQHWSLAPPSFDPIYIYVMECAGFYKVGYTGNMQGRLRGVLGANPLPVTIVSYRTVKTRLIRAVENEIHVALAEHRHRGEWFTAPLPVIQHAVNRCVAKANASRPLPMTPTEIFRERYREERRERLANAPALPCGASS